jgi:hypothetical protein
MPNFPVCSHTQAYNTGTSTYYNIFMQICIVILNLVHLTSPPVMTHSSYLMDQAIFLVMQTSSQADITHHYSILLSPTHRSSISLLSSTPSYPFSTPA